MGLRYRLKYKDDTITITYTVKYDAAFTAYKIDISPPVRSLKFLKLVIKEEASSLTIPSYLIPNIEMPVEKRTEEIRSNIETSIKLLFGNDYTGYPQSFREKFVRECADAIVTHSFFNMR